MKQQELARLFYREVIKIHQNEASTSEQAIEALYRLLNLLFIEATKEEKLQFTTLFARIAFAGHKFNLNRQLQFYTHEFRKLARQVIGQKQKTEQPIELIYQLGLKVITLSISSIFRQGIPGELVKSIGRKNFCQ
ncbi:MAG: hypothetical protein AAF985_25140, partial [Bacteroidota bacterium]